MERFLTGFDHGAVGGDGEFVADWAAVEGEVGDLDRGGPGLLGRESKGSGEDAQAV